MPNSVIRAVTARVERPVITPIISPNFIAALIADMPEMYMTLEISHHFSTFFKGKWVPII